MALGMGSICWLVDGQARCLGGDENGQRGDGLTAHGPCPLPDARSRCALEPVDVVGLDDAVAIGGSEPYLAVRATGGGGAWGNNFNGAHASELKALLHKLGYEERGMRTYRHPTRTAVFVGDFIDRGPEQVETVTTVRRMIDAGSALAVMGNHELNAIAWFLDDPAVPGEYLRPHRSPKYGEKNRDQHERFLAEVETKPALHRELVECLTLPLWLELPGLQVVHACLHTPAKAYLEPLLAPSVSRPREPARRSGSSPLGADAHAPRRSSSAALVR